MEDFNSTEYKRSRIAYIAQSMFEHCALLVTGGAFLAKLLNHVGLSDSLIGVISSFTELAFVLQILSLFVVRLKCNRKSLLIPIYVINFLLLMLMFLMPLIPFTKEVKTILIVVSVLTAYSLRLIVASIMFNWGNSCVQPDRRARYGANREIVSLLCGMIVSMVAGYVIDKFEGVGNLNGGFLFISVSILIFNICNFVSMMMMKNQKPTVENTAPESFFKTISELIKKKSFRNVVLMMVLYETGRYFTLGFLGIFKTKDLCLSLITIEAINIIGNFSRMIISRPFGRYTDKTSYAKGFRVGLCLMALAFFANIFTSTSSWYCIIIYTILYNCALAGTNMNSFNIVYSYVGTEYISQAIAVKNCIGGIFGFGASLVAGKILSAVQANGNMLFGIHIYGQQVLSAITFVLLVTSIIFSMVVIEKQEVIKQ